MKKLILTACLVFTGMVTFAQNINNSWPEGIDNVKAAVGSLLSSDYAFTSKQVFDKQNVAYLIFTDAKDSRVVKVTMQESLTGGDADMGVKGKAIISRAEVEGLFVDVYPLYNVFFHPDLTMDAIKTKGVTFTKTQINGKSYTAIFCRSNPNKPGYWSITVKDI